MRLWVPKDEIVYISGKLHSKSLDSISEPGQWLVTFYNGRNAYVPSPEYVIGKYCGFWRNPGETEY
jgi:hypothetical protein